MKKHKLFKNPILLFTAICGILGAASCGKTDKSTTGTDSDSIAVMEMVDAVTASYHAYLTKDSIGQIKVGMSVNDIPKSVDNLYDYKTQGASPDAVTITFYTNEDEGREQFVAYDFGQGVIDVLNVIGNGVKVATDSGELGMGDSFKKVLALPGVKAEWSGYDDSGMWYWTWNGIWFAPSQDVLPEQLSKLLYHSSQEPTIDDFSDEVTIGFIGTGLPF